ncbi:MAG: hypothetical protein LQ344_006225 [Seirophora lacunosa]|nr:MAG: hypothetical protein LQ344_006225 [Seirophora lacunosa]
MGFLYARRVIITSTSRLYRVGPSTQKTFSTLLKKSGRISKDGSEPGEQINPYRVEAHLQPPRTSTIKDVQVVYYLRLFGVPIAAISSTRSVLKTENFFVDLPKDLRTLNTMYCENDQMINHMKAPLPNISDDEEDSDSTSDGTDKKSWIDNSPDPTKDRSRPRHSKRLEKKEYAAGRSNQKPDYSREDILVMLAPSRKPKAMMQEELFARSIPCKRAKTDDDADWEFGPGGTAQDAIEFFSFFNGGGYEDKGPWAQPVDRTNPSGTAKLKQGLLSPKVSGESIS